MYKWTSVLAISLLLSPAVWADGHEHHGHHREHDDERAYYSGRAVQYVPAPQPAPRYNRYDQRSPQGLVGGALGSMAGYEMSKGDPLGAGIGAAAGAWIGNGMGR